MRFLIIFLNNKNLPIKTNCAERVHGGYGDSEYICHRHVAILLGAAVYPGYFDLESISKSRKMEPDYFLLLRFVGFVF
jgi:hypothetical protein